ncbi:hypothetical protein EZS27_044193, partial [termite gut metagenome]
MLAMRKTGRSFCELEISRKVGKIKFRFAFRICEKGSLVSYSFDGR